MCRRCVIIKGRAVGKSTEVGDDYNESLKAVLEHDKCVAIIEVEGQKVAEVNLSEAQMTEVRRGKYPSVSMGCFIPGKTLLGNMPMKTVTKISIEDGKLKTEGEPVCTCGEDDDDGPSLPHKTWCPRAGE